MSHMAGINHDMSNGFLPRLYFREADLQSCRHSRESGNPGFTWYRVRCARSQQLLAVPAPRAGFFGLGPSMVLALRAACGGPNSIPSNLSLLVQRKETKRKHAPDGALLLRSAALGPALTRRDILSRESAAGILPAALRALAQSLAGLGCAMRGFENTRFLSTLARG